MVTRLDSVDAVVVGAGWAGGIAAAELSKQGYDVVALEKGGDRELEDFRGSKDEYRYWSRTEMMNDLKNSTFTARNELDETAEPVRAPANSIIGDGSGGSGVHWNGFTFRWLPYDFEIYSRTVEMYGEDKIPEDMTIQDWGITYDEIEPYYDRFEKTAGISGEPSPVGPPRSDDYPNPPMKETAVTSLFKEAANNLGYHPIHQPSANLSQAYENPDGERLNQCVMCSFCERYGCDFGAKADPVVTVLSTARKQESFELRNHAVVTRVLHEDDLATGVRYVDTQTGEEFEQPADLVVLAGFVFTNSRLLLLSDIGEPYDPEENTGIIGKNFTGHFSTVTYLGAMAYFENREFNYYMGAGALGAIYDDYNGDNIDNSETDFIHGFEVHIKEHGAGPIGRGWRVPQGTPRWGAEFKDNLIHYMSRNLYIQAQGAALPDRYNYLDLDPTYVDALGNPLLRVTNKHTDQDRNLNRMAIEKCVEIAEEMGADIIDADEIADDTEYDNKFLSTHYAGGVIMGDDPDTSAVNTYSQMWDMENLFVIGGSSLPHFSNYNPTGTIGAFAYRATEGMIEYLEGDGGLLVEAKNRKSMV